ncbi:MAG: site-2 protease family protein [Candidatus Pacebacteria bacterium]|nr:site-2 protease family protein [Candidatus Paceibacterota bacterium]MBP9832405.1 site-2 protease family protein [Candidatus Paceibacterota bacterium]
MEFLIGIVIVILSIILHEIAHGFVANWLGDPTARYAGRLTLNPLPHIDPVGSILIPGILALTGSSFLIGWAKPVPYNPYNLKNQRWGEAMVGVAGPLTNILIALIFGLILRFSGSLGLSGAILGICVTVVYANLVLAIYNLIPIPPLDGSKVLRSILPSNLAVAYGRLETSMYALGPFGLIMVSLVAIYLLWPYLSGFVQTLFSLIVGT